MKSNKFIRILKLIGKGLLDFMLHFIRRIVTIVFSLIVLVICDIIWFATIEPNHIGKVTVRKVRRIRALSKLKLYAYKYFSWFFIWTRNQYMQDFYKKYKFLIEKKNDKQNGL